MKKYLTTVLCLCSFAYCFLTLYSVTTLLTAAGAETGSISLLTSCYYAGYIISQLPGGLLADRTGAKRLLLCCTLLNGFSVLLYGLSGSIAVKAALRVFGGLCCGPVMSSSTKLITGAFNNPISRTKNLGIMLAAPPAGLLLSNSVTPRILSLGNESLVCLLLALPSLVLVLSGLYILSGDEGVSASTLKLSKSVKLFIGDKRQLFLAFSGFFFMFVNIGFGTWGRKYFLASAIPSYRVNLFLSLFSIAAVLRSFLSGTIAEKLCLSHKKFLLTVLPLMAVCYLALPFLSHSLLPVFLPLLGFLSYLPSAHYTSLAVELAPPVITASAASSQNLFLQLGALTMSPVTGFLLSVSGFSVVWCSYALLLLLSLLLATAVKKS